MGSRHDKWGDTHKGRSRLSRGQSTPLVLVFMVIAFVVVSNWPDLWDHCALSTCDYKIGQHVLISNNLNLCVERVGYIVRRYAFCKRTDLSVAIPHTFFQNSLRHF